MLKGEEEKANVVEGDTGVAAESKKLVSDVALEENEPSLRERTCQSIGGLTGGGRSVPGTNSSQSQPR